LSSLQEDPVAQTVAPEYPVPPHWPYTVCVAPGADDVVLDEIIVDEEDFTVEDDDDDVLELDEMPVDVVELLPLPVQTAGPG